MQVVEKIRDSYVELDPEHAAIYEANAAAYLEELVTLHDYVAEQAALLPDERRVLVTAHDAFNYFGRAYGFEVRGLQGISTEAEASTADVQQLATFIAERRIPAIFVESSVPQRNVEAVQAAVRALGYRCGYRRAALLRRHGQRRHAGRNLHRHGPPQHRYHRLRTISPETPDEFVVTTFRSRIM
jgi:ABC-type Zn uptake system ZnuABC Zn-binding protein ZnuA